MQHRRGSIYDLNPRDEILLGLVKRIQKQIDIFAFTKEDIIFTITWITMGLNYVSQNPWTT